MLIRGGRKRKKSQGFVISFSYNTHIFLTKPPVTSLNDVYLRWGKRKNLDQNTIGNNEKVGEVRRKTFWFDEA